MNSTHTNENNTYQCKLLGNIFSYIIQFFLLLLSFSTLIYKRHIETPKRPWKIWGFDVGKQLCGGFFVHFANIGVSEYILNTSGSDECAWYFLNFFIDCTLGVGIVYLFHENICKIFIHFYNENSSLNNIGYYGNPPDIKIWLKQFIPYILSLFLNKLIITGFLYGTEKKMSKFGNWLFSPVQSNPNLELIIVMVLCPLLLTTLQYWLFDIMLKNKNKEKGTEVYNLLESI